MPELSVLIPARNEEWLSRTVQDLLENIEADTEILVGLDGYWPDDPLPEDKRVRILHVEESIGQRAMQNRLAKMSTAKYVAKTDAHCAFDKGFDRKLLARMEDDMTIVPIMRNLHVFDWVCNFCETRLYQGPQPIDCPECHSNDWKREIVWNPKTNPQSTAYRFNKNLQFKYFPELRNKLPREGLQESMSLQGSFFMCTREKYWELELCDESWGSWGQQGTEVALKTWLSGGRVLCCFDTWYAHLFRTQNGFSFPYPISGTSQERARKISRELFLNNKWPKQVRTLDWLIKKFWFALKDVRDQEARWEESDVQEAGEPTKGIIYYTAHHKPVKLASKVQRNIRRISEDFGLPLVSCSLKPMDKMGKNIVIKHKPGYMSMFKQILTALEASKADIIFFCEDDVLYHPSHFDFTPPEKTKFYYNLNWWRVREDGFAVHWDAEQLSQLVCHRELAIAYFKARIAEIERKGFDRSFEPGSNDRRLMENFRSSEPNIDFRFGKTQTGNKWSPADFRNKKFCINWQESSVEQIPGWDKVVVDFIKDMRVK